MTEEPDKPDLPPLPQNINDLVSAYVRLRDRIKQAEDAQKDKLKPAKEMLERMNGELLKQLSNIGGDSVNTPSGTVYKTVKKSASIADGALFRAWVLKSKAYDTVDWRANSLAVEDFIKNNGTPPPGVNFSMVNVVGVRRK